MNADLIQAIEALLPQTQCTRCGFPDCHEYAVAIATGHTPINQCPPGGQAGIGRLAQLLGVDAIPLNPQFGLEEPRTAAVIDENRCIGCTLCIQACPVDAIIGSAKRMHTVLTTCCSGCDLCVAPCPVDCIDMVELEKLVADGHSQARQMLELSSNELAPVFAHRYAIHRERMSRRSKEREKRLKKKADFPGPGSQRAPASAAADRKTATIAAAMKRARARHGIDK